MLLECGVWAGGGGGAGWVGRWAVGARAFATLASSRIVGCATGMPGISLWSSLKRRFAGYTGKKCASNVRIVAFTGAGT